MKFLFAGTLLFIKLTFVPNVSLLVVLFFLIAIDFATGVWKSKVNGKARTSTGFKGTVTKFIQYAAGLLASYGLAYVANQNGGEAIKFLSPYLVDGLAVFIIYIEVTSIFENLYEADKTTPISKYFFQPVLKILTFQIKNNPVIKQAEAMKAKEKD